MKQAVPVEQTEHQGMSGHAPPLPQGPYRIINEAKTGYGNGAVEGIVGKGQLQRTPLHIVDMPLLRPGKIQYFGIRIDTGNRQAQPGKSPTEVAGSASDIQQRSTLACLQQLL